jgi:hypothetical protein
VTRTLFVDILLNIRHGYLHVQRLAMQSGSHYSALSHYQVTAECFAKKFL